MYVCGPVPFEFYNLPVGLCFLFATHRFVHSRHAHKPLSVFEQLSLRWPIVSAHVYALRYTHVG